jgi:hypothetical protein
VDHEIEFPKGSKIHNVFHVMCLKKALGQQVATLPSYLHWIRRDN